MTDHLDINRSATLALRSLGEVASHGPQAQFVHNYVSAGKYQVKHEREGCTFCDAYEEVFAALNSYYELAKESVVK